MTTESQFKYIFSFLGLPASGKGTQADLFSSQHGFLRIGIGDLIRAELEKGEAGSSDYAAIKRNYDNGVPQPDEIVFKLVSRVLQGDDRSVVFDNLPFSTDQAKYVNNLAKDNVYERVVVIVLTVDPETVVKRITSRRICPGCGNIAIATDNTEKCQKCGGQMVTRSDDNEATVRARINHYLPRINEVKALYGDNVVEIDGEQSIEQVSVAIEKALSKYTADE